MLVHVATDEDETERIFHFPWPVYCLPRPTTSVLLRSQAMRTARMRMR